MLGGLRLMAPLSLRLMTDSCHVIREAAAASFRNFVPLMTLKAVSFLHFNITQICGISRFHFEVFWYLLLESKNPRAASSGK